MGDSVLEANDAASTLLARLQELKNKREEAAAANLASAKIEDAEIRTNPQTVQRLLRKKAKAEAYLANEAAAATGVNLERQNNLTYTIEDTQRWREKQQSKEARRDPGFTDYAQLTARKYEKLTEHLNGEALQRRSTKEAAAAMAEEIRKEQQHRKKHSRRRKYDANENITYVNERNARFNKKVARAYDAYTEELREDKSGSFK